MIHRFETFVTGITTCYKSIQRIKAMEMTEFGLKGAHAMCLFFLNHNPEGLTGAQLCQLCAEDKAAISRTLFTLRDQGYIQPNQQKYRAPILLTEAGKAVASRVDALIEHWVSFGGDGLSSEERTVFYRALDRISHNLRDTLEHNPI